MARCSWPTVACVLFSAILLLSQSASAKVFKLAPLPYAYNALEPVIDNQTMTFHHTIHHLGYVNNLNAVSALAVNNGKRLVQNSTLSELCLMVGTNRLPVSDANETTIRNQAGGAWNHAMFWRIMATPGSPDTVPPNATNKNDTLAASIVRFFGSVDGMVSQMSALARGQFGSGWAWLVYNRGALQVMATPNQDNPLMRVVSKDAPRFPLLCIDVWEHAYYLKYGPSRANYVSAWYRAVNWTQVRMNFAAAAKFDLEAVIGAESNRRV